MSKLRNRIAIVYTSGPSGRLARAQDTIDFVDLMRAGGHFSVGLVIMRERAVDAKRRAELELERRGCDG